MVLVFVLLAIDPPSVLMLIGIIYVASGLVMTVLGRQQWKNRRSRRKEKQNQRSEQDDRES